MSGNKFARIIKIIGGIIIAVGIIVSIVIGANDDKLLSVSIGGVIGSIISGLIFLGFGEIIDLLQENVDYQYQILRELKEKPNNHISKNNLVQQAQNDSAVSPQKTVKHLFRCPDCGKMIEEYPCKYCDFKFN